MAMKNYTNQIIALAIGLFCLMILALPLLADAVDYPTDNEDLYNPDIYTQTQEQACKPEEKQIICSYFFTHNAVKKECLPAKDPKNFYFLRRVSTPSAVIDYYCQKAKNKSYVPQTVWILMACLSFCLLYLVKTNRIKQR